MTGSIYEYIKSSVSGGRLPKGFELPAADGKGERIRFIPGGEDGVAVFHFGVEEISAEDSGLAAEVVNAAADGDNELAEKLLLRLGQSARAISGIDSLQQYIFENRETLSANNVFRFAYKILTESGDTESVKYALVIMEMFPGVEAVKDIVRTLGLYEEFTLFALYVVRHWENGNDEIFSLARNTCGWGRIFAVQQLEPQTEEIREWLFREGVHNTVMPAYSALDCWYKSEAEQRLNGYVSRDIFTSLRDIFGGLLDEGPSEGISALENANELIERFLSCAGKMSLTIEDLRVIFDIYNHYDGADEPPEYPERAEKIKAACRELLESHDSRREVIVSVQNGRDFELAKFLGVDCREPVMRLLREDFVKNCAYCCGKVMYDPDCRREIISLCRQRLPLTEMRAAPTTSLGLGLRYRNESCLEYVVQELGKYPLEGSDLIETALQCAPVRTRHLALRALESWVKIKKQPLSALLPDIYKLLPRLRNNEPDAGVCEKMDALL